MKLYAVRQNEQGFAFGPDTVWQKEFEEMFPFEETEDQDLAIAATKADMESTKIMDRLICGDVGYGKTEIAIRAAFKAVQDGKQVAFLVPTTILAQQHYNNFVQRMKDFPVNIDLLCRFRSSAEQKKDDRKAEKRGRWTSSSARTGCCPKMWSQGSGTFNHRRGAAFRRGAQGENQAAEDQHRCSHTDRDADSADAAHEPHRYPGYERAGRTADGPCAHPDICDGVQ